METEYPATPGHQAPSHYLCYIFVIAKQMNWSTAAAWTMNRAGDDNGLKIVLKSADE